jgi:hypothetical protein
MQVFFGFYQPQTNCPITRAETNNCDSKQPQPSPSSTMTSTPWKIVGNVSGRFECGDVDMLFADHQGQAPLRVPTPRCLICGHLTSRAVHVAARCRAKNVSLEAHDGALALVAPATGRVICRFDVSGESPDDEASFVGLPGGAVLVDVTQFYRDGPDGAIFVRLDCQEELPFWAQFHMVPV